MDNGRAVVDYIQTDASERSSLRRALHSVVSRHGAIKNIIYTAGVVRDGTIATVTEQDFEFVFGPKILGTWNIHCLSEEMNLELESFVMLSSIRYGSSCSVMAVTKACNSVFLLEIRARLLTLELTHS